MSTQHNLPADFDTHYGVALDDEGSMDFYPTIAQARHAALRMSVDGDIPAIYAVTYRLVF